MYTIRTLAKKFKQPISVLLKWIRNGNPRQDLINGTYFYNLEDIVTYLDSQP